jgi:hypothetical protein
MKRILLSTVLFLLVSNTAIFPQQVKDTSVYLLTCGPGIDTYSIYGHSAIRVVIPANKTDMVYNWGVFDFDTPNFAWKFAKGRLDYMLDTDSFQLFVKMYYYEKRYVLSQEINLEAEEKAKLLNFINENLKPENIKYRYDFFYDDCTTRIRDLLEKSIGEILLYPPAEKVKQPSFRDMVDKYQSPFPWLQFGINLIMGSPGDKKTDYRERMFLPLDMKEELSKAVVNRSGKMIPLLQNPVAVLDFETPVIKQNFLLKPVIIFTILLILVLIFSARVKRINDINMLDIMIFSVFGILAVMMIFFNFFTNHQQMKWNLNILWLNPFIVFCLFSLIIKRESVILFRIVFYISASFLAIHFILPQSFDLSVIPLLLVLIVRSSVRSDFTWNPLTLK